MTSLRRARRGYTLVALSIGLTVMMVLIAAVLPLASTQVQREREEELIFRGRQYAEAIRCFRRKYGRYPNKLKEMLDTRPRTLRKLWKDPITNSANWGLMTLGSVDGLPVPGQASGTPGSTDTGGFFGGKSTPTPAPTPTPVPTRDPFDSGSGPDTGSGSGSGKGSGTDTGKGAGGGSDQAPLLPVTGVYSRSKKKAFRVYQGRDTYDAWKFNEQTLTNAGAPLPPGGMGPGGRGPGITWP